MSASFSSPREGGQHRQDGAEGRQFGGAELVRSTLPEALMVWLEAREAEVQAVLWPYMPSRSRSG